jgi:hypothetical protein
MKSNRFFEFPRECSGNDRDVCRDYPVKKRFTTSGVRGIASFVAKKFEGSRLGSLGARRFFGFAAREARSVSFLLLLKMLVERLGVGILLFDLFAYRTYLLYDRVLTHIKPPSILPGCK